MKIQEMKILNGKIDLKKAPTVSMRKKGIWWNLVSAVDILL